MLSCRICFVYRGGPENIYIAPDALPPRDLVHDTLVLGWDESWPTHEVVLRYDLLHDGLLRGIMAHIGGAAGSAATYWRGGFQLYDLPGRARVRLTQEKDEGWAGSVRIAVQADPRSTDSNPQWLAGRIDALIKIEEERWGLRAREPRPEFTRTDPIFRGDGTSLTADAGVDPAAKRGFFISYAWGDTTPEGNARGEIVDKFCEEAIRRGIKINVDKNQLRIGSSISAYMDRLSQGNRIFVFLSAKYLKSENCVTELINAWRYSGGTWDGFDQRVKFYLLPCANIFDKGARADLKSHWHAAWMALKKKHESLDPAIMASFDSPEKREIDMLGAILNHVYEIATQIADHLQAPNFESFCDNWLADLKAGGI
jgi:internalin A